uniref:NADH-ubiquinone oxidoreductase chain 4L n=1 Tax=Sciurus vulgaris TaxID=55149 RepID=A0A8D2CP37_SCIVU
MPIVTLNISLAYLTSLQGIFTYQSSHLILSLLCLEGVLLSIFVLSTLIILNTHFTLSFILPVVLLALAACAAAVGLALLVIESNTDGLDYVPNLNILKIHRNDRKVSGSLAPLLCLTSDKGRGHSPTRPDRER